MMPRVCNFKIRGSSWYEAIRMLADGVANAKDIDTAMVLGYKHPMGPLELTDLVGLDVRRDILNNLQTSFGDDCYKPHPY